MSLRIVTFARAALVLALILLPKLSAGGEPFRFAGVTIDELQQQMAEGKVTAQALTAAYLERIAAIDKAGPRLNAVIEMNPDAHTIARQLDAERSGGRVRGPLHGIPVLIKDSIATADAMETTAGSLMLVGSKPKEDATLVRQLRAAGAVILGKTNLTEWANFRSLHATSGWSARGGQTRNPHVLDRNPSGSSSGSAVAVAADLCVVAVGTETDGSIVSPASSCGIAGIKPTVGFVSRAGVIPLSATQDTAGPMARTVRDAALLLEHMVGPDTLDEATKRIPAGWSKKLVPATNGSTLRSARIGVLRGPFGFRPKVAPLLARALDELTSAGGVIVELGELAGLKAASAAEEEVLLHEFKDGINRHLQSLGPATKIKSLADAIAFNLAHAKDEMPFFGQDLFELAQGRGPLTSPVYVEAQAACRRFVRELEALFVTHRLDSIVTLTSGPAWKTDPVNGDVFAGLSSSPAAIAGWPSVTVPAGMVGELPVGVSFTGRAWSDAQQIQYAAEFEVRTKARRAPRFLSTLEETAATANPAKTAEQLAVKSATVQVNGVELFYRQAGSGPTVLLLHGLGVNGSFAWGRFLPDLAANFTVIVPDLRGHGQSTNPGGRYTHPDVARDLVELLDQLHIPAVSVVGHSSGSIAAITVAVMYPERVEAMVLMGAGHRVTPAVRRQFREMSPGTLSPSSRNGLAALHARGIDQVRELYGYLNVLGTTPDDPNFNVEQLRAIKAKALVIWGDHEEHPLEIALELYRNIPTSQLWVVPGQGHAPVWPNLGGSETAASIFVSEISRFLRRNSSRSNSPESTP